MAEYFRIELKKNFKMRHEPFDKDKHFPRAKKKFGQHFLLDKNIIRKIVSAAHIGPGDNVIEIGPGTGALTQGLLEAGARVLAIEVDRDMVGFLKDKFPDLEVINVDALKLSYMGLSKERKVRFKVVSNLPYNISGPILARFLSEREAFTRFVLMFQKEVAERLVARPDTKAYGALSVFTQAFTDVKLEFNVSKNLFTPRPKVDSSVVSVEVLPEPKVDIGDEAFFRAVVRAAFGTRRKTLLNALKSLGLEKTVVAAALEEAGIDPQRRGETLDLVEFSRLAHVLSRLKGAG
jgi:16S rRNA (adenine1518-N6/adenine1519-N6)-dimethyltransferase